MYWLLWLRPYPHRESSKSQFACIGSAGVVGVVVGTVVPVVVAVVDWEVVDSVMIVVVVGQTPLMLYELTSDSVLPSKLINYY